MPPKKSNYTRQKKGSGALFAPPTMSWGGGGVTKQRARRTGPKAYKNPTEEGFSSLGVVKGNVVTKKERSSGKTVVSVKARNAKARTQKALPKNLNDIKNITNDKLLVNNVLVNSEDSFHPTTELDDITEARLFMSNIDDSIVHCIETHGKGKTIIACMAWLSNRKILQAVINNAKRVLFLVNDENFSQWKGVLPLYDTLPRFTEPLHTAFSGSKNCVLRTLDRDKFGNPLPHCQYEAVRCFGNASFTKSSTPTSLMHNKIIVFFDEVRAPGGKMVETPVSFITGSFNCTNNAPNSLENATFIKSRKGAERHFQEFSIIFLHSKPIRR